MGKDSLGQEDQLIAAVKAIHTAGLDDQHWPEALAAVTRLCGGVAATLEVFDKPARRHVEFHAFGVPAPHELTYVDHFLALNPRVALGLRQNAGDIGWDYQFIDEPAMTHDPFYADFLPQIGFRYFLSGVLRQTDLEFSAIAVQRSPAQGHVGSSEIAIMEILVPHLRQALDVAARLRHAGSRDRSLKGALDWLADGVALVAANGSILYANETMQAVAARSDGVCIAKGALVFSVSEARTRFALALAAATQMHGMHPAVAAATDFAVARRPGLPPYLVSVRPLMRAERSEAIDTRAVAMVFVHDPLVRNLAANEILREAFGFTHAEADLARALQSGVSIAQYARNRSVSLNTIYTHLRRIKEKTGCKRMGELIRKLSDLQVPLRTG